MENRMNDTTVVLAHLKEHDTALFAQAEVVGAWVWITFESKPSQETRDYLKAEGFHWNQRRACWQHCGGRPSRHSSGNPRFNYGAVPADAFDRVVVHIAPTDFGMFGGAA